MSCTIAVAGKGGTGKTTICGMLIEALSADGKGPVLAVDADANSNLNEVLGVEVEETLGDIREEIERSESGEGIPGGMGKQDYMQWRFSNAFIEEDNFDMLVMGRSQGKGCYCFVNGLLQTQLMKVSGNYRYIVVDNEAGMEHLSRGLLPSVDILLLVSDCSRRGVQAAGRIAELSRELNINPGVTKLVINRAPGGVLNEGTAEEIKKQGLDLIAVIPHDDMVFKYDCEGTPTAELPEDSAAKAAINSLYKQLIK